MAELNPVPLPSNESTPQAYRWWTGTAFGLAGLVLLGMIGTVDAMAEALLSKSWYLLIPSFFWLAATASIYSAIWLAVHARSLNARGRMWVIVLNFAVLVLDVAVVLYYGAEYGGRG